MNVQITNLPDEILSNICRNLSLNDMYNLLQVCSGLSELYSDTIWYEISCKYYGKEFWERALKRDRKISLPQGSYYKEMKRLKKFEHKLSYHGFKRYTVNYYYLYWVSHK